MHSMFKICPRFEDVCGMRAIQKVSPSTFVMWLQVLFPTDDSSMQIVLVQTMLQNRIVLSAQHTGRSI